MLHFFLFSILVFNLVQTQKTGNMCQKGTVYRITDRRDLKSKRLFRDLDCIFTAGKVPSKIPLGAYHLDALQILNTRQLNALAEMVILGKFASKVPCTSEANGTTTNAVIIWNNIGGTPRIPAGVRIGKPVAFPHTVREGEYYDSRDSLLVDYNDDIASRCPAYLTAISRNKVIVPKTETRTYFPYNQVVDLFRLVGVQKDGGRIYMGKMYIPTPFEGKLGTYAYFSALNYDLGVNPTFFAGQALDPLPRSYNYTLGRLSQLFWTVFPVRPILGVGNSPAKTEARNKVISILRSNSQLARMHYKDRVKNGIHVLNQIDKNFSSAYNANPNLQSLL